MERGEEVVRTGTTTVGLKFKEGVVLASEKRAVLGYLIAHKDFEKIYKLDDNIAVTIAGAVGDCQMLINFIKVNIELYKVRKQKKPSIKAIATLLSHILFQNRMSIFPYYVQLLLGGVDEDGVFLYSLGPDGSKIEDKYISTGSGSVVSYGVLEDNYKDGMSLEEAIRLAARAVAAATKRDIYSGGEIEVAVITREGFRKLSNAEIEKILKG